MKSFLIKFPMIAMLTVTLIWGLIGYPIGQLSSLLVPDLPEVLQRLIGVIILTLLSLSLVSYLGWWQEVGFVKPIKPSYLLLITPTVLLFWPSLYGFQASSLSEVGILGLGYLLTGLMEETLGRGVMLYALKSKGTLAAVIISSLLFGSAHFGRLLFGSALSTVLFQVMFASFDGVLFSALRLRTKSLWPVIVIHALGDFVLALGQVPQPLWRYLYLGSEVIGLIYGIFLLYPYLAKKHSNPATSLSLSQGLTKLKF